MNLRTIIQWGAVIAVVSWVVTNPAQAAGVVTTVFNGVVTFFKLVISGFASAF